MKTKSLRFILAGLLTTVVVLAPAVGIAQEKPKTPPGSKEEAKPSPGSRTIPFRGTVGAIDKGAMTLTVGERVLHVASDTKIWKHNKPATLADGSVGDAVAGNYLKGEDGKLTAKMIRFGPKTEPADKPPKKEKSDEKK